MREAESDYSLLPAPDHILQQGLRAFPELWIPEEQEEVQLFLLQKRPQSCLKGQKVP